MLCLQLSMLKDPGLHFKFLSSSQFPLSVFFWPQSFCTVNTANTEMQTSVGD